MGDKPGYNVTKLLLIGLVFHLFFIAAVFDCYFTSPVVHGMQRYRVSQPEAKRLVLIIGDGLRADLLFQPNGFRHLGLQFEDNDVTAPYLRSIANERGAFGISHTRVPTESRPGHVAIIGGMYEDVSAVTKGWKTNPVDFDSVFNQSSVTYGFGSPDIVPMFAHGATPGKVKMWCYDEEEEDFTKDATSLDTWVYDQFQQLLSNASSDPLLDEELRSDGVIIFLHLLGLDTTGHSYRPHSTEYMRNIRIVDNIVKQTEESINEFFGDEDTSFIFTADHGMSVIGNHGDGDPDNTMTPLVAWGKGIRGPMKDSFPASSHNLKSYAWDMWDLLREDVQQADLAALMATLIGIDWPVNSVGVLPGISPSKDGYLESVQGEKGIAEAALVNAKVLLEHYRIKHEQKQAQTILYSPFKPLEATVNGSVSKDARIREIESLVEQAKFDESRETALSLITDALAGLRYLETYQRTFLRWVVSVSYLGWIAFSSLYVFRPTPSGPTSQMLNLAAISIPALLFAKFIVEGSPWTYYVYVIFPVYFWHAFCTGMSKTILELAQYPAKDVAVRRVFMTAFSLAVMVFGYTHRSIWSVCLIVIGLYWPRGYWDEAAKQRIGRTRTIWSIMCCVTAVFPMLDVNKSESIPTILAGAGAMLATGYFAMQQIRKEGREPHSYLFYGQSALIVFNALVAALSAASLQEKNGLPLLYQALGWTSLVVSVMVPLVYPFQHKSPFSKMSMLFLAFSPAFIILSISVEGLFFVAFSWTLYLWVQVEAGYREPNLRQKGSFAYSFNLDDLRIVIFFLLFVQIGFFGTGNVASISSFYLSPVYRLIPVFSPFFMASLLIFKIIVPYIMLSLAFAALNHALYLPPFSLFCVAFMLTDVMTLAFFFLVTDTGSWLEIGQSITFFCISSLLQVWAGGICVVGEYLLADVLEPRLDSKAE